MRIKHRKLGKSNRLCYYTKMVMVTMSVRRHEVVCTIWHRSTEGFMETIGYAIEDTKAEAYAEAKSNMQKQLKKLSVNTLQELADKADEIYF